MQIIQDFIEDTSNKPQVKPAVQDPKEDAEEKPKPPPDVAKATHFVLDVKQRQVALTNAGLNQALSRLCKLPLLLCNVHTVTTPLCMQPVYAPPVCHLLLYGVS